MSELFDKSIRTLELPRVLQLLSDQAVSAEAKEKPFASGRKRKRRKCCASWTRPTPPGP